MSTRDRVTSLEDRIGYAFKDRELVLRALTHPSYGDGRRPVQNYERLEFLGDSLLGMVVSDWLYRDDESAEGTFEWDHDRVAGCKDPRGDDGVDILLDGCLDDHLSRLM